ncbi:MULTISPECIES: hypothetical protein [Vibrio]|uniref:hypothetical protein n=1 Tax=Vibrio TaxID=662 RepID=UPI00062F2A33|nr:MULTISPECIES: hypothetical protein [Vibrio]MCC4887986.1 hypothetical protein [Vibrio sp. F13]TCT58278.1 hypothetical protein EDB44_12122 [Vibrio crassostreae]TCT79131.1 hypothetical protein EDB43_12188 [Vibrio crassostreae]CAK2169201.1 conserved hypothetical protein [Vibrio crassostreae]CAK2175097.1 conserved hypothetical protein [Vibrio crassostreae]
MDTITEKITIHLDKNSLVIAVGKVASERIIESFDIDTNELPLQFWENISSYSYINGKFIQSDKIDVSQEASWQKNKLSAINAAIAEYQADMMIDERYSELRVGTYSEEDYFKLLGDRKLLIEYVQQEDFPECGRPMLSSLEGIT